MTDQYPIGVIKFAELVSKSPDTIRAGVRAGEIQHHRRGRRGWIFFTEEDLRAYLDSTLVPARIGTGRGSATDAA